MKPKLLVFFGIIAVGIFISTISLTKCRPNNEGTLTQPLAGGNVETPVEENSSTPINNTADNTTSSPANPANKTTTDPVAQPKTFRPETANSPEAKLASLANLIAKRDYQSFMNEVGDRVSSKEKQRIKSLIENPNLELDSNRPYWEMARSSKNTYRWMLNFIPVDGNDAEPKTIQIDLTKIGSEGYKITRAMTPATVKEIAQMVSNKTKTAPTAPESPGDLKPIRPVDPIDNPNNGLGETAAIEIDSLTVAQAFTLSVLNKDFISARQLSGEVVTDERIAGLMIALEDGSFSLREDRPLVVALANEKKSMVLSRVFSPKKNSEFALTLKKENTWFVNELTFGKVIAALAKDADATTYSPIVEDPAGGDSLVVYFEFDNSGLNSRADNQLKIVANILKQDRSRRIRITGHADSLGTDDYNRKLSQQRATSIRNAIIERGANPEQVITEGYGESKPRKPNFNQDGSDNPQGRSLNRRAEVYLDF